jgi:hypothetical protein
MQNIINEPLILYPRGERNKLRGWFENIARMQKSRKKEREKKEKVIGHK